MMCEVKRRRLIMEFLHKIVSVYENVRIYDHWLTNKAYLSAITVTNIFRSFTYKMAAKTGWHRYETKLRYCHAVCRPTKFCCNLSLNIGLLLRSIAMSMHAYLCVREHISETTRPIFPEFCACYLRPWLCPPLAALRYVMYFR